MTTKEFLYCVAISAGILIAVGLAGSLERRYLLIDDAIHDMGENDYYNVYAILKDSLAREPKRSEIANYWLEHGRD